MIKHFFYIAALVITCTSCTRTITINKDEAPGDTTLFYNDSEYVLPVSIEYIENSLLTFQKEHYRTKMVDISEIEGNDFTPRLTPKQYTLNLETYYQDVAFYINGEKIEPPVQLPYGEYTVSARLDGYIEKFFTVLLDRDTLHQLGSFEKPLTVINIPKGITVYNSEEYTLDEGIEGSFAPPYLTLQFDGKKLPMNVESYIQADILDFSLIAEESYRGRKLGANMQHPGISVSANWLEPSKQAEHFPIQPGFTVGFHGPDINLPEISENQLYNWNSSIVILNPTDSIIESTVRLKTGNETKTIQITKEMLYKQETFSDPFEDRQFAYIDIYRISAKQPFKDTEYEVSLFTAGQQVQNFKTTGESLLSNDQIAVYPQKRTSAFTIPREENDNIYYIYVSADAVGKYLLVYEHLNTSLGDDGIFSPVYAAQIISTPDLPAVVKIDPRQFTGDVCFIVQNPKDISGQDMIFSEKIYLRQHQ